MTTPGSPERSAQYLSAALPLPVRKEFEYRIPDRWRGSIEPGQRVRVPFGNRQLVGYCVEILDEPTFDPARLKEIGAIVDTAPLVGKALLRLTRWIADYYHCSWGEALSAVLPAAVRRGSRARRVAWVRLAATADEERLAEIRARRPSQAKVLRVLASSAGAIPMRVLTQRAGTSDSPVRTLARQGVVEIEHLETDLDPTRDRPSESSAPLDLSDDQERALGEIVDGLGDGSFRVDLLWGVTGSGKTEVYLQTIRKVIDLGAQAIVLVPEIALTPQTVRRFRARFERIAVLHSRLSEAQRRDQWEKIARGEADVVIGPRSAVFAPVPTLGLIVLDEEHEPSFKQNSVPRYHAREVAIMRAYFSGCRVLLGSATPSMESYANSMRDKFQLRILPKRIGGRPLPPVELIDMTREVPPGRPVPLLSRPLADQLRHVLEAGEQAILFRNRRGHSTILSCFRCGHVVRCPHCDVTLTYHASGKVAICHYCRYEQRVSAHCPDCGEGRLSYRGAGTERIESVVEALHPGARIARMDSDTMVTRHDYERVLGDFEARRLDILIGTQMIAKGLDFPAVTLVGVLSADAFLYLPDFRAAERTFQLVTLVAGRAGRSERGGRVVVQTTSPEHYAIRAAAGHDYAAFCRSDLAHRRELGYPPFGRLARIVCHGPDEARVRQRCDEIARPLRKAVSEIGGQLLGPAPCPIARIEDRFRWHLFVKAAAPPQIGRILKAMGDRANSTGKVHVTIDIDPVEMT